MLDIGSHRIYIICCVSDEFGAVYQCLVQRSCHLLRRLVRTRRHMLPRRRRQQPPHHRCTMQRRSYHGDLLPQPTHIHVALPLITNSLTSQTLVSGLPSIASDSDQQQTCSSFSRLYTRFLTRLVEAS